MKIGASIGYEYLSEIDGLLNAGYEHFEVLFWGSFSPSLDHVLFLSAHMQEKKFNVVSVHLPNVGLHKIPEYDKKPVPGRDIMADVNAFEQFTSIFPEIYVIHPTRKRDSDYTDRLQNMVDNLNVAQECTRGKICLENLPKSRFFTPRDTVQLLDKGYKGHFTLDTSHACSPFDKELGGYAQTPTEEILALVDAYGDRLKHMHISDKIVNNPTVRGRDRFHRAIGDGEIDWRVVLDKLNSVGYTGYLIVETRSIEDTIKSKAVLDELI